MLSVSINECVCVSLQPGGAFVMSEQIKPLPTDHVFVLQLQESHGRPGTCRTGRVEHLSSGEAARFASKVELWDFVEEVLTETIRRNNGS